MVSREEELVISEPLDPLSPATEGGDKKRLLYGLLDLFKSVLPGSDLSGFQVPVQFNMPKSQLQLYGESVYCCSDDLLLACAKGSTPLQRFLCVVAWHISTTRVAPFARTPFNPILGETHHVSCGLLNVFLEQVSHHPPISALYAVNDHDGFQLQWWQKPCPQYHGNRVEVNVQGRRELFLNAHKEVYEMTCPKLVIRFFPTTGNEWVGKSTIKCSGSQLQANLLFHARPFFSLWGNIGEISGQILDSSTGDPLFDISGSYKGVVSVLEIKTGETKVLFDAQKSLANLKAPKALNTKKVKETESVAVWRLVMEGLVERDWEVARKAKHEIEERQRALAKKTKKEMKKWIPKYFELVEGDNWQWLHNEKFVEQAPLFIP